MSWPQWLAHERQSFFVGTAWRRGSCGTPLGARTRVQCTQPAGSASVARSAQRAVQCVCEAMAEWQC